MCKTEHVNGHLKNVSNQCKDLLHMMIASAPLKRPTARQALSHEWFSCDKNILQNLLETNQIISCSDSIFISERDSPNSFGSFRCTSNYFGVSIKTGNIITEKKGTFEQDH